MIAFDVILKLPPKPILQKCAGKTDSPWQCRLFGHVRVSIRIVSPNISKNVFSVPSIFESTDDAFIGLHDAVGNFRYTQFRYFGEEVSWAILLCFVVSFVLRGVAENFSTLPGSTVSLYL